jgi:hypothetical protein
MVKVLCIKGKIAKMGFESKAKSQLSAGFAISKKNIVIIMHSKKRVNNTTRLV